MNIVIISFFRNAVGHVSRYFEQVRALHDHAMKSDPSTVIRVVAVEGDSFDRTRRDLLWQATLNASRFKTKVVEYSHGQRVFGSTEDADRLSALTGVMKAGLAEVDYNDHMVLYVESDLIWHPHDVGSVIDRAWECREGRSGEGFDVVAPLVFAGDNFYDVYAFRGLDGSRFAPFKPYHASLSNGNGSGSEPVKGLIEISSAGSCLAFRAGLARTIQPIGEQGLVSWCAGVRQAGFRIAVDTRFKVRHP